MEMLTDQEQERFIRLWTEAWPAVSAFVRAAVRDPEAANDLLQETAVVLVRRFADYDRGRPFLAWALGVARFQILGFHRDEARRQITYDADLFERFTEAWAAQAPAAGARSAALEECVERLESRPRQILRWRYFENLNSEEIARRLGTPAAAVRVTLQRLREKLRLCVERRMRPEAEAP